MIEQWHVLFGGYVQGVGFRYTCQRLASRHGLQGWVRNCPDGRVEAVFQGEPEEIKACILDLHEHFPNNILACSAKHYPPSPTLDGFEIRP